MPSIPARFKLTLNPNVTVRKLRSSVAGVRPMDSDMLRKGMNLDNTLPIIFPIIDPAAIIKIHLIKLVLLLMSTPSQ
jgi:hypothetical protein